MSNLCTIRKETKEKDDLYIRRRNRNEMNTM